MTQANDLYLQGGEHSILLIHGLTGSPFELKYVAQRLHASGFTVSVPCLAGHGATFQELARTRWHDWYATAKTAFDNLKKTHKTVSVGGLCMGAVLALLLAASEKNDVKALALLSTTLSYDGWATPWYQFLITVVYYTPFRYMAYYTEREPFGIKNERLRRQVMTALKNNSIGYLRFPCTAMHELQVLSRITRKKLREVTAPALIIHSLEDDLASIKNAEYVERHISSNYKKKIILNDSYHMVTIDNQRSMVVKEMIQFFQMVTTTNPG